MSRKTLIYTIVVLAMAAAAGCAVVWLNLNRRYVGNEPVQHLPASTAMLVRINGIDVVRQAPTHSYWADLTRQPDVERLCRTLLAADSILSADRLDMAEPLLGRPMWIALCPDSAGQVSGIAAVSLRNFMEGWYLWKNMAASSGLLTSTVDDGDVEMMRLAMPDSAAVYFAAVSDGIFWVSRSRELLSQVVQADSDASLCSDATFTTVGKTMSDNAPVSIFVHLDALRRIGIGTRLLSSLAASYAGWGTWVELDVDMQQTSILLNGFLSSAFVSPATVIAGAQPKPFRLDDYIPSNVNSLVCYGADARGYSNKLFSKSLHQSGRADAYSALQANTFAELGVDVEAQLSSIFAGELALFSPAYQVSGDCLALGCENGTIAQAELNALLGTLGRTESPEVVAEFGMSDNLTIPVFSAFADGWPLFFLGEMFDSIPSRYYLRYENALFFADNLTVLHNVVYDNMLNRTLKNEADYQNFRSSFPSDMQYFSYMSSTRIKELCGAADMADLRAAANFYGLGLQVSCVSGLPYVTIGTRYAPNRTALPPTAWQSRLDTTMTGRPYVVENHNTGEHEILVQDASFNIYLVNSKGLSIWKRKLDGPIVGGIEQIDYYHNGKLQYLFCTPDCIHIIDRNGNNTGPFPIMLPAPATSQVRYIDYGNPADFRLFVACSDKQICLYDREGNRVQGWNTQKTDGPVTRPLQHFTTGGKDYLVAADAYRCYVSDRRGNERLKPDVAFAPNPGSEIALVHRNQPTAALVTTDAAGNFVSVAVPSGKVTLKPIDELAGREHFAVFDAATQQYFVFIPEKMIILDADGNRTAEHELYLASLSDVRIHNRTIALWDSEEKLGYLVTFDGKIVDGFPVPAASPLSIMETSDVFNIIAAGIDGSLFDFLK